MFAANTIFLVVDDVESMRKINSAQLRALGASQILLANNGAEALRILTRQPVHVILSDWNMPVMDGLEQAGALFRRHRKAAGQRLARLHRRQRVELAHGSAEVGPER